MFRYARTTAQSEEPRMRARSADISRAVLVGALRSVRDSPTNPALSPPSVRCECSRCTPGLSAVYHQRHRGVSQAGWSDYGSAAGASAGRGKDRAGGRDGPAQETAAVRVRLFNDLSAKPDICNPMTAGSPTAGSQMGSQRRQAVTRVGRPTAPIGAGNWLIRRRPATVHDGPIAPEKRAASPSALSFSRSR
jgi:hypothetical protein